MECPTCKTELQPTTYEDVRVMQCGDCSGYFVAKKNLRLIKTSREQSGAQLTQESERDQGDDTAQTIQCPKCRVQRMEKRPVRTGEDGKFYLDECDECHGVWLDGGELARLQIKYESSAAAIDAFSRQERMQTRTEAQKADFEDRLANLPKAPSALKLAGIDLALIVTSVVSLIATIVSWLLGPPLLTALFSIVLAAIVAWFAFTRLDEYLDENRFVRFAAPGVVAVLEIVFLILLFLRP